MIWVVNFGETVEGPARGDQLSLFKELDQRASNLEGLTHFFTSAGEAVVGICKIS
jgi:hypothetical protein